MSRPAGVGDYRWIADAASFAELVDELASCDAYALDTEFHRERTYFPHLALLQLAWEGGIALVDPLAIDIAPFAKVLDGPGLAVLHAAEQDLEVLERACGTVPSELFDTQVAAGFLGQVSPSLVKLVERVLGVRLLKGDQLTDWTRSRPARLCRRRRGPPARASHEHQRPARGDGTHGMGGRRVCHRLVQGPLVDRAEPSVVAPAALAPAPGPGEGSGPGRRRLA